MAYHLRKMCAGAGRILKDLTFYVWMWEYGTILKACETQLQATRILSKKKSWRKKKQKKRKAEGTIICSKSLQKVLRHLKTPNPTRKSMISNKLVPFPSPPLRHMSGHCPWPETQTDQVVPACPRYEMKGAEETASPKTVPTVHSGK